MPDYFFTAKSPSGKKVTEHVKAESADEAHTTASQSGYTEIVLHTDDVSARFTDFDAVSENLTASDYVRLRTMPGRWGSIRFLLGKFYGGNWKWNLFVLVVLVVRRWLQMEWRFADYFLIVWLVAPGVWAIVAQLLPNRSLKFNQLIEASAWARWNDVLELVDRVKGVAAEELAFRKATALAGLGKLDAGLAIVEPFSDGQRMPQHMYHSRLSEVFAAAGQFEKMLPCMEHALDAMPDDPIVQLDLAMQLLRFQRDLPRCKELLDQARSHALSDVLQVFVKYVEGIIAVEEQRFPEARQIMSDTHALLTPFKDASPLMGSVIDRIRMYQALIEAKLGNDDAARKYFRSAAPRLFAHKSKDLIERCRKELGPSIMTGADGSREW